MLQADLREVLKEGLKGEQLEEELLEDKIIQDKLIIVETAQSEEAPKLQVLGQELETLIQLEMPQE